jgi:chromosome segregation ATPase
MRLRIPKRRERPQRTKRRTNGWASALGDVRTQLQACTQELDDLRRTVTNLRAELNHLREKIRG